MAARVVSDGTGMPAAAAASIIAAAPASSTAARSAAGSIASRRERARAVSVRVAVFGGRGSMMAPPAIVTAGE